MLTLPQKKVVEKTLNLKVKFYDTLSSSEAVKALKKANPQQIVLWYVGCNGLKISGVNFYREQIISPLIKFDKQICFWLLDLSAWNAFKKTASSISKKSSVCAVINGFSSTNVRCISSADLFNKLKQKKYLKHIGFFENLLQREFITRISREFPKNNILVRDIFYEFHPSIKNWNIQDANKAYSAFQYLEGCLLIEEILSQLNAIKSAHIELFFVLPNNEINYYQDDHNSFDTDLYYLIKNTIKPEKSMSINITFLPFKYGSHVNHRPYNAPGQALKSNKLSPMDIVGD